MKLSIIIPAYNEIRTIAELVRRVEAIPVAKELILVDNCSTDGTREWIRDYPGAATRILHPVNAGKGSSVRDGLAAATGELAVIQDADLEYDPAELPGLMRPIVEDRADVVFGSRVLGGKRAAHPLFDWGGRLLNVATNALFGGRLSDVATCYKLMHRRVFSTLRLSGTGFELDFELAARILKAGWRVKELPISYRPRTLAEGKKIRLRDGARAFGALLRVRRERG